MDAMDLVAAEKARARRRFRARRAALSPEARAAQSEAIRSRVLALFRERRPKTVSAFWPLAGEVDLRPLLREWGAMGVRVALPAVASEAGEAPRLEHRLFTHEGLLTPGRFGVMEPPAEAPPVSPEAVDLAIVPALAADARGVRLGYGGGFYDAYLAQTPALCACVVFAEGVAVRLPAVPHDVRVHRVLSPEADITVPGHSGSAPL